MAIRPRQRCGGKLPLLHCGAGRPPPGMDPVDFVLLDLSPTERLLVEEAIARVGEAVPFIPKEELSAAMNKYNQKAASSP